MFDPAGPLLQCFREVFLFFSKQNASYVKSLGRGQQLVLWLDCWPCGRQAAHDKCPLASCAGPPASSFLCCTREGEHQTLEKTKPNNGVMNFSALV